MTAEQGAASIAMIKAGYKAFDEGAMDVVLGNWHPNVVYYGFDPTGQARVFRGIGELFAMFGELAAKMEVVTNDLVDIQAVGADLVVCRVRANRKPRGGALVSHEFMQVLRVENGKITHGVDMISAATEAYYKAL